MESRKRGWRPTQAAALLLALTAPRPGAGGGQLVGGGALSPYSGPGRSRSGGWGYVRDFPVGFFVAGSSLQGMNGLYARVPEGEYTTALLPHVAPLLYQHERTKWYMMYVNAKDEGRTGKNGMGSEWLILDDEWRDRFIHEGDTYLPGCCDKWEHAHNPDNFAPGSLKAGTRVTLRASVDGFWEAGDQATVAQERADPEAPIALKLDKDGRTVHTQAWRVRKQQPGAEGDAVAKAKEDDRDELPWQVIAIMSPSSMNDLRQKQRQHDDTMFRARVGEGLPAPGSGSSEVQPPGGEPPPLGAAEEAAAAGNYKECADLYAAEASQSVADDHFARWRRASLHRRRAACLRRGRDLSGALDAVGEALALFPRYASALFERAATLLDAARYNDAMRAFETLLRVDHDWPDLSEWMVRTVAHARRGELRVPIADGFCYGDRIRTRELMPGYWGQGEEAQVIGFGSAGAPLLIEFQWTRRKVNVQGEHFHPPSTPNLPPAEGSPEGSCSSGAECAGGQAINFNSPDHYHVLGVPSDCTDEELKRAYRGASRRLHPDKPGGSAEAFQRVASAHATLSDPRQRRAYDLGVGAPRSPEHDAATLQEEVERRYFPERFGWHAFGDPHEEKRRQEQQRKADEERKRRAEEDAEHVRRQQQSDAAAELDHGATEL